MFSRAWRLLPVFALNSDWFVALFTPVVIGQSNFFGLVLRHSIESPFYLHLTDFVCCIPVRERQKDWRKSRKQNDDVQLKETEESSLKKNKVLELKPPSPYSE